jgi:hypothetical protein
MPSKTRRKVSGIAHRWQASNEQQQCRVLHPQPALADCFEMVKKVEKQMVENLSRSGVKALSIARIL